MESAILGLVLDSSVLIAAERRKLSAPQAITSVRKIVGDVPIALSAVSIAEIGHGIYRANTPVNLPLADLLIGACALELGYAVGTGNARDFNRIPVLRLVSV